MTSAVLNQTQTDADGHVYFDDFVGDGDLDAQNKTLVSIGVIKNIYFIITIVS